MPPPPTDTYELPQFSMARAHEVFKAGFESISERLDDPPMDDLPNFLGYCQAWADSIVDHHDMEEAVIFHVLNQKLDFSEEMEQHKIVHAGLNELLPYIHESLLDNDKFDAATMKRMMSNLRQPLYQHLDQEVEDLAAEKLKVFDEGTLQKLMTDVASYSRAHAGVFTTFPFMRCHTAPEWKDAYPPLPWFVKGVLVPYIFANWNAGFWKYAPYAMS